MLITPVNAQLQRNNTKYNQSISFGSNRRLLSILNDTLPFLKEMRNGEELAPREWENLRDVYNKCKKSIDTYLREKKVFVSKGDGITSTKVEKKMTGLNSFFGIIRKTRISKPARTEQIVFAPNGGMEVQVQGKRSGMYKLMFDERGNLRMFSHWQNLSSTDSEFHKLDMYSNGVTIKEAFHN